MGLWNQLAVLGAFALPLALWRRRLAGTLLAFGWIVALFLTYSRGGILTTVVVVVAWFALTDERTESAATLVAAAVPAGVVSAVAFLLPGVTSDGQSDHVRWRDGLVFGVLLLAGAAAAVVLERLPRPRVTPALRRGLLAAAAVAAGAAVVFVVVEGGGSGAVGNSGGRLGSTSSNFRFVWWRQAWREFRGHELLGAGAGSFHLANLRFRSSFLDFTIEPHNLPLQFLAEAGIVGLVLLLLSAASLLRGSFGRRGHELALALVLPAFLLHSLVDIDWDFVAVSALAFLVAGALVGKAPVRRVSLYPMLAAAGAALLAFGVAVPALARRALVGAGGGCALAAARDHPGKARALGRPAPRPAAPDARIRVGHLQQAARRPGLLRAGGARPAEEPRHAARRRPVRAGARVPATCLCVPRALHGARPEGSTGDGRDEYGARSSSSTRASRPAERYGRRARRELAAVQRRRPHAVERADDVHVEIVGEADALGLEAALVHHDGRRVVLAGALPLPRIAVAEAREPAAASADAAPVRPFPLNTKTPVAERLSFGLPIFGFLTVHDRCVLLGGRSERRRLGVALHRVGERLREQDERQPDQHDSSIAATRLATSVAVRQGRIRASAGSGASTAGPDSPSRVSFSYCPARFLRPGPRPGEAVVERDLRAASRARARSGGRRARSAARRRAAPARVLRLRVAAGDPGARGVQVGDGLSRPVPTLYGPPAAADGREQRADDVVDVDEVACLRSVAEDHRVLAARDALEEDRDHAALEPGVLARAVDVREPERTWLVPWMRFQPARYSSPHFFAIPYGESGRNGDLLGRGLGALAVAGAAGRGEDHLCALPRASSTFAVPTTFTAAS